MAAAAVLFSIVKGTMQKIYFVPRWWHRHSLQSCSKCFELQRTESKNPINDIHRNLLDIFFCHLHTNTHSMRLYLLMVVNKSGLIYERCQSWTSGKPFQEYEIRKLQAHLSFFFHPTLVLVCKLAVHTVIIFPLKLCTRRINSL